MPIYEYCCEKCNVQVEEFLSIPKMKKSIACPKCKGRAKKVMSKLGFVDGGFTPKSYK